MTDERETGYYWVMLDVGCSPEIAHWNGFGWHLAADERRYSDEQIFVMGERLKAPIEGEQP